MAKRDRERREIKYNSAKDKAVRHTSGFEGTCVKVPEGMKLFKPEGGKTYRLDFMPYLVTKGGRDEAEEGYDPAGNPNCNAGFAHYERTYYAHRGVGSQNKWYICPNMTFKKKCPICQDLAKLRRTARSEAEIKAIKSQEPKERQLFLVLDTSKPDDGVMLWDFSYFLFGKMLDAVIKEGDEDEGLENFYLLEGGSTVKVNFESKTMDGGRAFPQAATISMKARKSDYDSEEIDKMPDLDELLVEQPYDKLKAAYEDGDDDEDEEKPAKKKPGADDDDDDDDDKPASKSPKKKAPAKKAKDDEDEDEGDDDEKAGNLAEELGIKVGCTVENDEHGECEVVKVSPDGSSLTIKDEDGEIHKAIATDDCSLVEPKEDDEDEDDEDEEEKPAAKKGGKKPAAKKDEDDGWDEDDKPAAKKKAPAKKGAKKPADDEDDD